MLYQEVKLSKRFLKMMFSIMQLTRSLVHLSLYTSSFFFYILLIELLSLEFSAEGREVKGNLLKTGFSE